MRIKSQRDFFAGLLYVVIGGAFAIGANNYTIGNAARMGPGYFPLLVGILLAILGAIIVVKSLVVETPDGDPIGPWAWKPLIYIILANFLFGLLLGGVPSLGIPSLGVMVGILVLTLVAAKAGPEFKLKEVIILAIVLAAGSWLVFIWGLNLQMPVWPSFISG
ncbi:tripartite tricarboxylate transporter TctB family protein [Ottowia sp.]|uniref:tripartite tricarboxylate transporter TctB family protein n=1 Tax=Ottowia sp. TaxID=1898956 RepID=UPI002CDE2902|nr:tripartite tricarboxylate transporter TctB family protein [Ottowia sp.]HNR81869.1 tripartite tricarboxylate transporter TctB family protein [Ottowia sp.]